MTYVRTKDGLWVYNEKEKCAERPNKEMGCTQVWLNFKKEYIIKQAGTIEELCDRWVVRRYVMDEPCHWLYSSKEQMKADISLRNKAYSIYGAIWVVGENNEPILKSVAKMNDKGELELL